MKIFIIIFVLFLVGCNIFEPRKSEAPDTIAEWNAFTTTADKCLENLLFAFNHKENIYQYGNILSEGFTFYFDTQDINDFTLPVQWGKEKEIDMLINLYQQGNNTQEVLLSVRKIDGQSDTYQSNNASIYRQYELNIAQSTTVLSTNFSGKFMLYLEKGNDGLWKIHDWYDYRDQSEWTWGRMKNAFSS